MLKALIQGVRDTKGATAIEYALTACLIAIAATTGMKALGTEVSLWYAAVNSSYTAP